MNGMQGGPEESLDDRLDRVDRQIRRERLRCEIEEAGGLLFGPDDREDVSDVELSFLDRVLAWERGPRSTHRAWLARQGRTFIPPAELDGRRLKIELWRLIRALAGARVFLYHTNHLSDRTLYEQLWSEVLPAECPDFARTRDDACHRDFADPGSGDEETWLGFYASNAERREWQTLFPGTPVPPRSPPPFRRDHRLPVRD
jgi:hypothetical protein